MTRLFDPQPSGAPRLFATPLGVDFCAALLHGLDARLGDAAPEDSARVEIYVANARMLRRVQALYLAGGPRLLPRLRTVGAMSEAADLAGLPPPVPPLRLRLGLAKLVHGLIENDPEIAPRSAIYPLADSLASLMGEMFEERVTPEAIAALDMGSQSRHWERSQAVLAVVDRFFGAEAALTAEARQAQLVDRLEESWRAAPPEHPVLVAGSTGSRGATARLMQAVARLPQGAVILPGLDRDQPRAIWERLTETRRQPGLGGEDHPQYRLARVAEAAGVSPADIPDWAPDLTPPSVARNRLVSLALRPAPVTDQWRVEGPRLDDLTEALRHVTLLEAPNPQTEAAAIALVLRKAAEEKIPAALVSPDRTLTRQVAAALDRWRITPDDSAGQPLSQTAPGRFLRLAAQALAGPLSAEALVALLSHPLTHTGADRGPHLRFARELELDALRGRVVLPVPETLTRWAEARKGEDRAAALDWAAWVSGTLLGPRRGDPQPFGSHVAGHLALATALAAGPGQAGSGKLFEDVAGEVAARLMDELATEAEAGGSMSARDYADVFSAVAADRDARSALRPHARIQIWGTLEARVQGAELLILAGLNDGVWPAAPSPDPWLNRALRDAAGLRLPDRVIGLSAHDFQQAVAAPQVWLSRARRDAETDTVPSRWLNRIVNLLDGASDTSREALADMRKRGAHWVAQAEALLRPADVAAPAPRPAPAPPAHARPDRISVTEVEDLIRDPYKVYARRVLRLRKLDPLRPEPDAAGRGSVLHDVMERFIAAYAETLPEDAEDRLIRIAQEVLEEEAPWPSARRLWLARFTRVAPWVLRTERERREVADPDTKLLEVPGTWQVDGLPGARPFRLTAKADRIDRAPDGRVVIYDYKSGKVPTADQERSFNKQLWLEAVMAGAGAFGEEGPLETARIAYLGLGATPEILQHDPTAEDLAEMARGFRQLVAGFLDPQKGFPSRRAVRDTRWRGDFDHLARYGEWDETSTATVLPVGDADP